MLLRIVGFTVLIFISFSCKQETAFISNNSSWLWMNVPNSLSINTSDIVAEKIKIISSDHQQIAVSANGHFQYNPS